MQQHSLICSCMYSKWQWWNWHASSCDEAFHGCQHGEQLPQQIARHMHRQVQLPRSQYVFHCNGSRFMLWKTVIVYFNVVCMILSYMGRKSSICKKVKFELRKQCKRLVFLTFYRACWEMISVQIGSVMSLVSLWQFERPRTSFC